MSDYANRATWLRIRDNGGSLQQFLRSRARPIFMPEVKQGKGRNGIKRAIRLAHKRWFAIK